MDGGRMASREAARFASDPLFGATNSEPSGPKIDASTSFTTIARGIARLRAFARLPRVVG